MKRSVFIACVLFFWGAVFGQFNNPIVNGVITANEYGNHSVGQNQGYNSSSSTNWYCTWNDDSIFFAAAGGFNPNAITGSANGDAVCIYVDINPALPVNGGNGLTTGTGYDGVTPNLPFSADVFLFSKHSGGQTSIVNSGSWGSSSSTITQHINYSTYVVELKIAWTDMGLTQRPTAFNWLGFISFDNQAYTGGSNGSIAHVPSLNPGGVTPNLIRYYTVDTTTNGTTVQPFERESYTHIGNDVNNFGDINVWDFTMNTSGKYISRAAGSSGDWNIGNDLLVGNGIIYFNNSSSQTNVAGDIITLSGGTLDVDNSTGITNVTSSVNNAGTLKGSSSLVSELNLKLNFANQGTFTTNNTKFTFNGSSIAQTISGDVEGNNSFGRLAVNNPNGLIDNSNDSLVIEDTIYLTNGVVQVKKYVVLRNGADVLPSGGSDSSYVDSCMIWGMADTDTTIFPVGNDGEWAPIGLKPQNSTTGRLYKTSYAKKIHPTTTVKTGSPLLHVSYLEHWYLDELSGASASNKACQVSLYWRDYSEVSSTASDWDSLKVSHFDTTALEWDAVDYAMNNVNGTSKSFGIVKTNSYTSNFSPFTIGSAVSANPLPVNLISFAGNYSAAENAIELHWQSASELNCNNFSLQKKIGQEWVEINNQSCEAVSNHIKNYLFQDHEVLSENVYRLIQQDFDGKVERFGPVMVSVNPQRYIVLPNPARSIFTISNAETVKKVSLIDALGRETEMKKVAGSYNVEHLRHGVYTLLILDKLGKPTMQRLVVAN